MKRKIILTDNLRFLKRHLYNTKKGISCLVIEESNKSNLLRDYLLTLPNAYEITSKEVIEEKEFVKEYSIFVHNLNLENAFKKPGRIWWTLNFTSKNPLLTSLCENIFQFLIIAKLLETRPDDNIVVVLSKRSLVCFIKSWAKKKRISIRVNVSSALDVKFLFSRIPAFFIFYSFLKLVVRMLVSKLVFKPLTFSSKKDYIVVTQFENNSFKKDGSFHDIYFGQLREFLKRKNKTVVVCGFVACAFKNVLRKGRYSQADEVYPLEYFISATALFKCLKETIFAYFRRHSISGNTNVDGENVLQFVKKEIDNAFYTGQTFINLSVYYSVKGLLGRVCVDKILYPFENRSWEKMILLAARETQRDIKLSGYQHASLTPKHINFILERGEIEHAPYPDELISMGRVTKALLEDVLGFSRSFVKLGCALRQKGIVSGKVYSRNRSEGFMLFAALASNLDEYVRMLRFLDKASINKNYTIKIRPHPCIDFQKALNIYKPRNLHYLLDRNKRILDSLKDSSIVLYASSTVGIEALSIGKPVIYIDFGNFINSDPLFSFSAFKWECEQPKNLPDVVDEINSLDKTVFKERQEKGILYAKDYFYPVNSENIKSFM